MEVRNRNCTLKFMTACSLVHPVLISLSNETHGQQEEERAVSITIVAIRSQSREPDSHPVPERTGDGTGDPRALLVRSEHGVVSVLRAAVRQQLRNVQRPEEAREAAHECVQAATSAAVWDQEDRVCVVLSSLLAVGVHSLHHRCATPRSIKPAAAFRRVYTVIITSPSMSCTSSTLLPKGQRPPSTLFPQVESVELLELSGGLSDELCLARSPLVVSKRSGFAGSLDESVPGP